MKQNWQDIQKRFVAWWHGCRLDRPLMKVVARRDQPTEPLDLIKSPENAEAESLDVGYRISLMRNFVKSHCYMADAYPGIDLNIGAGSMAIYLGCEPIFTEHTIWFKECVDDWRDFTLAFNADSYWLKKHLQMFRDVKKIVQNDFFLNIPDIVENVDILSALRGPQRLCYDLIDEPERIKAMLDVLDELYFKYYDAFYEISKRPDGSSSYTVFNLWAPGKTAKLQSDFSAMMSPAQFIEFVIPSLTKQCRRIPYSMYHLDGTAATRHLAALLTIKELKAVQWTPGEGQPDGLNACWFPLYERIRDANKSLWIYVYEGDCRDWIKKSEELVKKFGTGGLYFNFPVMQIEEAQALIDRAAKHWH